MEKKEEEKQADNTTDRDIFKDRSPTKQLDEGGEESSSEEESSEEDQPEEKQEDILGMASGISAMGPTSGDATSGFMDAFSADPVDPFSMGNTTVPQQQDPALLTRLTVSNSGVLYGAADTDNMQIGFRMQLHPTEGGTLLCKIYYGNRTQQNVQVETKMLSTSPGLQIQASPLSLTVEAAKQSIQSLTLKCNAPFDDSPRMEIKWTIGSQTNVLQARLPFIMTKFFSQRAVPSSEYMQQWQGLSLEAKQIINLRNPMDKSKLANVLQTGMSMQVIPVTVAKPTDILCASNLTLGIKKQGTDTFLSAAVLLRVELNPENTIIRVTTKSKNMRICECLNSNLKEVFGPRST